MDPASLLTLIASVPAVGPYLGYFPLVVAICAIVDAIFPQPLAGSRWVPVRRLTSLIGGNFGAARNAVPAGLRVAVRDTLRATSDTLASVDPASLMVGGVHTIDSGNVVRPPSAAPASTEQAPEGPLVARDTASRFAGLVLALTLAVSAVACAAPAAGPNAATVSAAVDPTRPPLVINYEQVAEDVLHDVPWSFVFGVVVPLL